MLPAPTRIAAPPSPNRAPSWTPAVPPPPVAGAAVTVVLGATVTVAVGVTVTVAVAVAVAVWVAVPGELAGPLPPSDADAAEPLAVGDNGVGDPDGVDDEVQPETAARPTRAAAPQPAAASRARSAVPARTVRTL